MRFDAGSVPVGYLVFASDTKTHRRDPGPGALQRPADVRQPAGRLGAAAVRRQSADRSSSTSTPTGCAPTTLAGGSGRRPSTTATRSALRQRAHRRPDADRAGQRDGRRPRGAGQYSDPAGHDDVYLRDVGHGRGRHATSPPATPWSTAGGPSTCWSPSGPTPPRCPWSTRSRTNLPKMQAALPDDINVSFEFDQSPYVTDAMRSVAIEGLLGAVLTGLMVLLFLRDWRSVIVVVLNIPLASAGAAGRSVADRADDQSDDPGRPGAGGRHPGRRGHRRDREHPHANGTHASHRPAVRQGNRETAVPRLLAMLCILAVFMPSFFMEGAARALFVPLSLAVGFAMVASYLLSSTFVPVLSTGCCGTRRTSRLKPASGRRFDRERTLYGRVLRGHRALALGGGAGLSGGVAAADRRRGRAAGDGDLPAGRCRPVPVPAAGARRARASRQYRADSPSMRWKRSSSEVGPRQRRDQRGLRGPDPVELSDQRHLSWTGGPEEAVLRVAFKHGSGVDGRGGSRSGCATSTAGGGVTAGRAVLVRAGRHRQRGDELRLAHARRGGRAGARTWPTTGPMPRRSARAGEDRLAPRPAVRAGADYPSVECVDREQAGPAAFDGRVWPRSLVAATSSSRFIVPNYWPDPKTRHRLPGAGRDPLPGDELDAGGGD